MKSYTWFISKRISLSRFGKNNSPAIKVAITGVALSICIMLLSIAIVNGFKKEITDKVVGFNSEIILYPSYITDNIDDNLIELTKPFNNILDTLSYIDRYHLVCSLPAILKTENDFKGIYLKGVGSDYDFSFISNNLTAGKLHDFNESSNKNVIYISQKTADELKIDVGDEINSYFISNDVRARRLKVGAIFNTHFEDYDNNFIFGNIKLTQDLCGFTSTQGSSLEIHTKRFDEVRTDTYSLFNTLTEATNDGTLQSSYRIDNILTTGANYFGWLALLDTNVVVILVLMIIVACFTLIAAMMILILEKIQFIGILKTLGATNNEISKIFVQLSIKISLIGLFIGNLLALTFLVLQNKYHFVTLNPQAYYIDFVPTQINYAEIIVLNLATILIIWLVLLIPSRIVSKISPSEIIKYE